MNDLPPQMIIVGGPNGAGKTTFVRETQEQFGYTYLGADKIAADICPESPESVAMEAGRQFIIQIAALIGSRENFVVESTLSGRSFRRSIEAARRTGYVVDTTFVFVKSTDASIARVAQRVRQGGHHVPTEDVERRFQRCLTNFWDLYRPLSDRWSLVYNQFGRISVANGASERIMVHNQQLFDLFHQLREQTEQ